MDQHKEQTSGHLLPVTSSTVYMPHGESRDTHGMTKMPVNMRLVVFVSERVFLPFD